MNRRNFLKSAGALAAVAAVGFPSAASVASSYPFTATFRTAAPVYTDWLFWPTRVHFTYSRPFSEVRQLVEDAISFRKEEIMKYFGEEVDFVVEYYWADDNQNKNYNEIIGFSYEITGNLEEMKEIDN